MRATELASRYARALFETAVENGSQEKIFNDLRALEQVVGKDAEIQAFLTNPRVAIDDRIQILQAALADKGLSQEVHSLILLLARNDRLALFNELVLAFEAQADTANNVGRGTVRSAVPLGPAERQRIEETVERVLNKKVILTYKVDPEVIGGLIAQVGSYTFDDTIASHLRRMNEELKRRTV